MVTEKMRSQKNRNISNDELLNELQRVSNIVGRRDISAGDIKKHSNVGRDIFALRFGSLEKARKLAGLEGRAVGAARLVHTHEALFANLYDVWVHYGRQPHYSEMNELPSKVKAKNYTNRFKTWRKALLAFIDYMQRDSESVAVEHRAEPSATIPVESPTKPRIKKSSEDKREISLGLRFKVLTRDSFKCVLCGGNPPANPGLVLHIDHILPWSKGGKTTIENLRTLCEACNLGRGNRYSQ